MQGGRAHPQGLLLFGFAGCDLHFMLCPWDFPAKNTGMSCHFVLQGTFPTQRSNPRLLDWQVDSLLLNHQGSLAWPCRDKKTPLLNLEEELIMEAWHLFEKDKEVLLSLPTFLLIIKLYRVLGVWHPLALLLVSLTRAYPSISLLLYHFASHWILSVLRQKGLWYWSSLEAPWNDT